MREVGKRETHTTSMAFSTSALLAFTLTLLVSMFLLFEI